MRKAKTGSQRLVELARQRQPRRPHFIAEWAERRGFETQASLAKQLDADKSVVSRWYDGASPTTEYQEKLAALFGHPGEPEIIFRHPDSDWMARFLQDKTEDDMTRIKRILESAFPSRH